MNVETTRTPQFSDFIEAIPYPLYLIDVKDYKILIANEACHKGVRYQGSTCYSLMYKSNAPCEGFCPLRQIVETATPMKANHILLDENGKKRTVEISAQPVFNSNNEIVYIMESYIDITALIQTKARLREREEIFRSLVQSINGYIYSVKYNNGKIIYIYHSPQSEIITGYTPDEYRNDPDLWIKMVHHEDREKVMKFVEKINGTNGNSSIVHRICHKEGTVKWVLNLCSVLNDAYDGVTFKSGLIIDITEQKKIEEQLKLAKEQAEEAIKMRDRFVSLVSHDLKNPINIVKNYLHILKEIGPDQSVAELVINEAIDSCNSMTMLIKDILDLSRVKGGTIKPHYKFFKAREMVQSIIDNHSMMATQKGVGIINEVVDGIVIYSDEKLYKEVITNLVSNAIKFSKKNDMVIIFSPEGAPSTLAVSDTGVGMDDNKLAILFRSDIKKSSTGTQGEIGTGLGLTLAFEIMSSLGGELTAISAPGKGSTFFARLPEVIPRVVVIDAEEPNITSITEILGEMKLDIFVSYTEHVARQFIDEVSPHLVLLNPSLPNTDCLSLLRFIKGKNIPVILISKNQTEDPDKSSFKLSADDFIPIPLSSADLISRVKKFVG